MEGFFNNHLASSDPEISDAIDKEMIRQKEQVELIASENIVSKAVLDAQGSILTNKYAEGYSGKRYYGGCEYIDVLESIGINRVKEIFSCDFANIQPHSGAQANQAVFMSLLEPGDTILGMSLAAGGHLTHGAPPNLSGKWFKAIQYGVRKQDSLIDFDQLEKDAMTHRPKLLIAGGSAYPRTLDFKKFREIADKCGAKLLVDMAHISGLVATGDHPSPIPHAHVVTSTTHKTLRCGRGGMILTNDELIAKKVNSAVFPGLQGGPLMHAIAGKVVGFGEALKPEFKVYIKSVINNAKVLSEELLKRGLNIVSGGTDTHVVLVDLRPKEITGNIAEDALERAGITCNKNGIPFDPEKPSVTSGIRLGTPAGTSRGFGEKEFILIANLISDVLDGLRKEKSFSDSVEKEVKNKIKNLCYEFPIY
ncbi:MAG: serine hydroxymethyltransferase [Candidatus Puniceispirillales bacterium]